MGNQQERLQSTTWSTRPSWPDLLGGAVLESGVRDPGDPRLAMVLLPSVPARCPLLRLKESTTQCSSTPLTLLTMRALDLAKLVAEFRNE